MVKLPKINYRKEALEFIGTDSQVNFKLGGILSELKLSNIGEQYANAIEDLSINDIAEAVVSQNINKWSKRILELRETEQIRQICPDAKIIINTYEEMKFSLSEITDYQVVELSEMFEGYSIKITVESNSLLVTINEDDNEDS
jgi:hypothetical protein